MASYTTSCPAIPDLDGTCEIVGNECTSYTSNTLGAAAEIKNESTSNLKFKVKFIGAEEEYKIDAHPDGSGGYSGSANGEPWTAGTAQSAVAG